MSRARDSLAPIVGIVALLASVSAQLAVERRIRPRVALPTALLAAVGVPAALRVLPPRWDVRWMGVGGRRSGWFGYAPLAGQRGEQRREDEAEPPRPLPELRDLVGVVAIGQTRQAGTATLTLLSLERYGDGFLVRGSLRWNEEPLRNAGFWLVEPVDVTAADDRGTVSHGRSWGGGGASWRFDHAFTSAVCPVAAELLLTVPALRRQRASPPRSGRSPVEERTDPGPWAFVVPLSAGEGRDLRWPPSAMPGGPER